MGESSAELNIGENHVIGLFMNSFDTYQPPLQMSREVLKGSINRFRSNPNHMGTQWSDVLVFSIDFIKDPCNGSDNHVFTEDEIDYINSWLTSSDYPTLLHIYDSMDATYDEETDTFSNYQYMKYNYFGVFSNVEPVMNDGYIIGLKTTFSTNSPFAWTDEITHNFECMPGEDPTIISFDVNHAEKNREIYPVIMLNARKEDDLVGEVEVEIKNLIDGTIMKLIILKENQITIDSRYSRISDISGVLKFDDLGIEDVDYIYWPKIYNGNNQFAITVSDAHTTSPVDITIKYREARKVGAY